MIYLTLAELLYVAERTLGADYAVRDYGGAGTTAGDGVREGCVP